MSLFRNNVFRVGGLGVLLSGALLVAGVQGMPARAEEPPAAAPAQTILLGPGRVQTLAVKNVQRIAIGDPKVADVTIVSPTQLLVQARQMGATNLLVWDEGGERELTISVVDPRVSSLGDQLPTVLERMGLPGVTIETRGDKVFLVGEVQTDKQFAALDQIVGSYEGVVVNLVQVTPTAPSPAEPAPLVKLAVQVVELNRTDLQELGINWSDSLALTQPSASDLTMKESFRWGTGLTRGAFSATINALEKENKAKVLSEPHLVTSSGKAASSFIGVEVPVIKDASLQSGQLVFTTEFRKTGVLLKITPTVVTANAGRDKKITTILEAEVSDIDTSSGLSVPVGSTSVLVPGFKVRNAKTEVTTASGEAIVIAGLLDLKDSETSEQLPYLGNVPIIGRFFRSPKLEGKEVELVITVTPELVVSGSEWESAPDRTAIPQLPQTAAAPVMPEEFAPFPPEPPAPVLPEPVAPILQEPAMPTPPQDTTLAPQPEVSITEVTVSVEDPRLAYLLQIQQVIAEHLRYPDKEEAQGIQGALKLRMHLYPDGHLAQAHVVQSSGVEAFDQEALRAARSLDPYPPFPAALLDPDMWIDVPVIFRPS